MMLSVTASADYDLAEEMFLTLMVEPPIEGERHRVVQESLRTTPIPRCVLESDLYGNPQRRIQAPKGFFTFDFTAIVEALPEPTRYADDFDGQTASERGFGYDSETLLYTLPSRFCPSDLLNRMAVEKFGESKTVGEKVAAICEWTNRRIQFQPDRLQAFGTAGHTVTERMGGRHDMTHLVITFCRALGIPARYVSGYTLGMEPNDFHAWAQVFVGDAWLDVDATSERPRPALIPIAIGRDAADVPIFDGRGRAIRRGHTVFVELAQ